MAGKDSSPVSKGAAGFRLKDVRQETLVFGTTIVIFTLCAIFVTGFFTLPNISTLARSVSVLGILGVGMTVVVIGRGLDLSQVGVERPAEIREQSVVERGEREAGLRAAGDHRAIIPPA